MTAVTFPPAKFPSNGVPLIQPYSEALDYQMKRTAMHRDEYYSRAMDGARPLAFTITGLEKDASLIEANRLAEEAIRTGMTMSDYCDRLGEIIDAHGGTMLSPSRLELIYHNTMANNNAAGAWRQIMDPESLLDRPYLRYRGDADACPICGPLRGLIVHHSDPILKHIWPPNHHWCGCEWESLAADDVDDGDVYKSPEGYEYPVINGRTIRPADGWDFNPAEAFAADDTAFTRAAAELSAGADKFKKVPSDYGLTELLEPSAAALPSLPTLPNAITRLEDPAQQFAAIFGIAAGATRTIVPDFSQAGVWVTGDSYTAIAAAADAASDDLVETMALTAATLQEPAEVWFVPMETPSGETTYVKRYFGVFARGNEKLAAFADRSPQGWLMRAARINEMSAMPLRTGLLSYARSSGSAVIGRKP
jgi:hypothetical protein